MSALPCLYFIGRNVVIFSSTTKVVKDAVVAETRMIQHLSDEFAQRCETLTTEKIVSNIEGRHRSLIYRRLGISMSYESIISTNSSKILIPNPIGPIKLNSDLYTKVF